MPPENKRKYQRVRKPLIIRFRDPLSPQGLWEVVSSLNISQIGICFLTMKQYSTGVDLELKMTNAELGREIDFMSRVVRSEPSRKAKVFFETAVTFGELDSQARGLFERIIKVAIDREQQK